MALCPILVPRFSKNPCTSIGFEMASRNRHPRLQQSAPLFLPMVRLHLELDLRIRLNYLCSVIYLLNHVLHMFECKPHLRRYKILLFCHLPKFLHLLLVYLPTRPTGFPVIPPVDVAAARLPILSSATAPTVPMPSSENSVFTLDSRS